MRTYLGCHWINNRWTHSWSDGTTLAAIKGRDETDDEKKKKEGEGGGTGGGTEDEDDEDDDDDDDDDVDTSKIKDPVAKAVADAEAAARHKWRKKAQRMVDDALAQAKAAQELEGKSELEKEKAAREKAEGELKTLKENFTAVLYKSAWSDAAAGRFDDAEIALSYAKKLPEWENVEEDEDDPTVINGLREVADALAKKRPGLLRKEGEPDERQQNSGRPMNGPKKTKKELKDAELLKKYPALRR